MGLAGVLGHAKWDLKLSSCIGPIDRVSFLARR